MYMECWNKLILNLEAKSNYNKLRAITIFNRSVNVSIMWFWTVVGGGFLRSKFSSLSLGNAPVAGQPTMLLWKAYYCEKCLQLTAAHHVHAAGADL
jgi:hypothetical protein